MDEIPQKNVWCFLALLLDTPTKKGLLDTVLQQKAMISASCQYL
jgi:hypothetical protein